MVSGLFGRATLVHSAARAVGDVVVVKAVKLVVMSEVDIREASRIPSRPKALPTVVPLLSCSVKSVKATVLAENVVTAVESTLRPVTGGVGEGDAGVLPNAALPVTLIRTAGRGYKGVFVVACVRSQLLRNGSQRFGVRNQ